MFTNALIALFLSVMVYMTTAEPKLNDSLEKMTQVSGDVMAFIQELKDSMYAEEGMLAYALLLFF